MLGTLIKRTLLPANNSKAQSNFGICLQFVRWRMPRWVPSRPRKLFFIPEKPAFDSKENEEVIQRTRVYNTCIKSLKAFMYEEKRRQLREEHMRAKARKRALLRGEPLPVTPLSPYMQALMESHEKWNAESKRRREERVEREAKENEKRLTAELSEIEEERKREREKALSDVIKAQEEFYINESNVDAHIEKLLQSTKNYNFVIDLEGNRYTELSDESLKQVEQQKTSEVSGSTS